MKTYLLTVTGLVQGVGMRPYVCNLGRNMGLKGLVRNSGGVLEIEVNISGAVEEFIHRLYKLCPKRARIDEVLYKEVAYKEHDDFQIEYSSANTIIPALPTDIGLCEECKKALTTPGDRRYKYPFITCTSCGPRYTVMRSIPYDRERTAMDVFEMCDKCREEYYNPDSRYFYAQTISCPDCGPKLYFYNTSLPHDKTFGDIAFEKTIEALKNGEVVAVKNIGGFHFVCDAENRTAVCKLRAIKQREKKPFAVSFLNPDIAREFAYIDEEQLQALTSDARPIVLCDRRGNILPKEVCCNSDKIGTMLPANALQYMLNTEFKALIMTSANISGEPMITEDDTLAYFENMFVLSNDREILLPVDDSIVHKKCGKLSILRRARGYVPEAINTDYSLEKTVLLTGADMKGSVGVAKNNLLFMSQNLGDMEHERVIQNTHKTINKLLNNHCLDKEVVVSDAHPGYNSSKLFEASERIYHHEAHAAAVIFEKKLFDEKVLAFSLDGTGYGRDETIWGSEAFIYENQGFKRVSSVVPFRLAGGDRASRDGRLALASILCDMLTNNSQTSDMMNEAIKLSGLQNEEVALVKKALEHNIGIFETTSMGRLFDAVSALLKICENSSYEGEAAIELMYAAKKIVRDANSCGFCTEYSELIDEGHLNPQKVIGYLLQKMDMGINEYKLAHEFHYIIVYWMVDVAKKSGCKKIAVSGGTAANELLLEILETELKRRGMELYFNEILPPGDDGIVAGQLAMYVLNNNLRGQ